ncbi:MAG TPA: 50S ribosomal protein L10 [Polyangium sp.]|jgi:large subunit ribosomal protein L10|nr:50S ribosomal protein L10 [Polyangium sp.]
MERADKDVLIGEVKQRFDRMTSAVFLDFKGLNVAVVTKLRDEFRKAGVEYRVVKNTLVRHAVKHHKWANKLDDTLTGMTGIAWSYEDPSAAAKVVKAFRKEKDHEKLVIKAGLIDGQLLNAEGVENQLATMPGKNELRATLLATMAAPMQQFLQQLNAPGQNFVYLLKAKEDAANKAG